MTILITGGAGYIGSHMAWLLHRKGEKAVVIDDLSTGIQANLPPSMPFIKGNVGDETLVAETIKQHTITAIIHFAGSIVVPESVSNPLKYYQNNTSNTRNLLAAAVAGGVGKFIFSSTAAVYGTPAKAGAITEETPLNPISPYGSSKLMSETMIRDTAAAHNLKYGILRYFNVAGADPEGKTGQSTPAATHLIKVAAQVATGKREDMQVFGTDYPTPDGTCVRDYIHVADLANAHYLVLKALEAGQGPFTLNCGYGKGASVNQVLTAYGKVLGKPIAHTTAPRRPGDPAALVADATKLRTQLGWKPEHENLETIIAHAHAWESNLSKVS